MATQGDRHNAPEIGGRIKATRQERSLTLDQVSVKSGVSKSMLSQIERGQANPTFATLWNLTRALGISIEDLLGGDSTGEQPDSTVELISANFTPTITSADGKCRLRILSPLQTAAVTEWYEVTVKPGGVLDSEPHTPGTIEHLTVVSGALRVTSGGEDFKVRESETARYAADVEHTIANGGRKPARAFLVVTSPV